MVRSVRFMVTGPYRGKGYFPCLCVPYPGCQYQSLRVMKRLRASNLARQCAARG